MMSKKQVGMSMLFLLFVVFSFQVLAIPNTMNIQGKLTNASGSALNGTHNFTFRIYDAYTGGTVLYESNHTKATDARGVYDIILENIDLQFNEQYYLGITLNEDSEMSPRSNLSSSPYAKASNISYGLNASGTAYADIFAATNSIDVGGGFSSGGLTLQSDGDIITQGDIIFSGNITILNVTELNINGSLIPNIDAAFDIGNGTRWRNANFSGRVEAGALTVDNDVLFVDGANDRVGIGTSAPTSGYALDVRGRTAMIPDSEAEPSLALVNSLNNAFRHRFYGNGNAALAETGGANVSIGKSSANFRLDVEGTINSSGINVTGTVQADSFVGDGSGLTGVSGAFANDSDINVTNFVTNNTLFVNGSMVGMGTASPDNAKLHIKEDAVGGYGLKITNRNNLRTWGIAVDAVVVDDNQFAIIDDTGNSIRFLIDTNGDISLGKGTSASAKLDVRGDGSNILNLEDDSGAIKMAVQNDGSIGIGTTSPQYLLQVANGTDGRNVNLSNTLFVNGSKVGIGTSSPATAFSLAGDFTLEGGVDLNDSGGGKYLEFDLNEWGIGMNLYRTSAFPNYFNFRKARNTLESPAVVSNGDGIQELGFYGYDGDEWVHAASIQANIDGTPGNDDMPGSLIFKTTADDANSVTNRMIITNAGNVGIGTDSPSEKLVVIGSANISDSLNVTNTVQAGSFVGDGSALTGIDTSFANGSDINVTRFVANNTLFVNGSRVGIGIEEPSKTLDVRGEIAAIDTGNSGATELSAATNEGYLRFYHNVGGSDARLGMKWEGGGGGTSYLTSHSGGNAFRIQSDQGFAFDTSGALFDSAPTELMRITSGGNVGINTTTPSSKLEVVGNASVTGNVTIGTSAANTNITMYSPDGSPWNCGPDNTGTWSCSN